MNRKEKLLLDEFSWWNFINRMNHFSDHKINEFMNLTSLNSIEAEWMKWVHRFDLNRFIVLMNFWLIRFVNLTADDEFCWFFDVFIYCVHSFRTVFLAFFCCYFWWKFLRNVLICMIVFVLMMEMLQFLLDVGCCLFVECLSNVFRCIFYVYWMS